MARTFIRQETQIRNSDAYTDTLAAGATLESGSTEIETDLNGIRSQINRIIWSTTSGNWYDDVPTINSKQRGVRDLNFDLDELETQKVLCRESLLTDITVTALTAATNTLDATANFGNGESVTTGTKTYTFETILTNVDGNVLIGGSASDSLDNLIAAINLGAGAGTVYALATTANGFVSALAGTGDTMDVTALVAGTAGNVIVTTELAANATWLDGATLIGGTDAQNWEILSFAGSETPSGNAAVLLTTDGVVVAQSALNGAGFNVHELIEVVGGTAIYPKNLMIVRNATNGQLIQSAGRDVFALLQFESTGVDGAAFDDVSGGARAKLSFVRQNAGLDDLEACPVGDIAGFTINYAWVARYQLDNVPEDCFLGQSSFVDGSANTNVTRQLAYDNQGTTPVELDTNATLDLDTAGITWIIRDLINANLLRILEGSTGGTSEIQFGSSVDVFNNDAIVNDFASGIQAATGGVEIDVGVSVITDTGTIETTGTNDLRIFGARELFLDDVNQVGSTWAQTNGIKLSDTTGEWDAYETAFGGEVSLLAGKTAAYKRRKPKVYANVTVTTTADLNVSLADANLDVALPNMSGGSFLTDYDVFLNGDLLRPGADATANNDYYPGTALSPAAQLRFEFTVKINDVLCVVPYA